MLPPILVLLLLLVITTAAFLVDAFLRKRRATRLAAMAAQWQMRFTAEDPFQLTPRIAAHFPIPGAADVVVRDLVYGQEDAAADSARFRYFFTIEYTLGVLRTKRRRVAVGTLVEAGRPETNPFSGVTLAPAELSLQDQYQWLRRQQSQSSSTTTTTTTTALDGVQPSS
jgi:hypothetical protein